MRKQLRSFLLSVPASLFLLPGLVQAQCLNSFPADYVPLQSVYYISDPNVAGDRLVVGTMTLDSYRRLQEIPPPNGNDQTFCNEIQLAPGYFARAYVPTSDERIGDFSPFDGLLLDPVPVAGCRPFPGGIIPRNRLPDPFAWRILAPQYSAPFLEIKMSKPCYLNGDTVTASRYRAANPTSLDVAVELKVWRQNPGMIPTVYDNEGADGSLVFVAGYDLDSGPVDLFVVTSDLTRGTYEFSSRTLDPFTGQQLSVNRNFFLIP